MYKKDTTLENIFNHIDNNMIIGESLEKFKKYLNEINILNYQDYIHFDDKTYKKNLVKRNQKIELYIICWKKGQSSSLHSHPKNGCLMKILNGNLEEIIHKNKEIKSNIYNENQISYIHDKIGKHIIRSLDTDTISLHIYSPPKFYETN
jgi:cysteine dioxygenase